MLSHHSFFFFFNDTATTEIYTLSLHDALPICLGEPARHDFVVEHHRHALEAADQRGQPLALGLAQHVVSQQEDRKSTRLNSSHLVISYAVFCLKKKKNKIIYTITCSLEDTTTA